MPNTTGAYQPFGSGWQNLSNYLTKSNIGAISTEGAAGGARMERYQNPDAGSQFDDWLSGVAKSRQSKDISTKPAPVGRQPTPSVRTPREGGPEETPTNPAEEMAGRKRGWMEEQSDNPYRTRNPRYEY